MATLWLFIVGVISLVCFEPIKTAYVFGDPSLIWRFVTLFSHMVSHGSWEHLFGNFMFGAPFMIYLEGVLKDTAKFVRLYFALGLAAFLMQNVFNSFTPFVSLGLIGSSGAVFGLVGASLMLFTGPTPLVIAARLLLVFHIVSQAQMAIASLFWPVGVAYAAHLGGLLGGVLFSLHHRRRHLQCRFRNLAKWIRR